MANEEGWEARMAARRRDVAGNYYVRKSGNLLAAPIANRGPEALQALLVGDRAKAEASLRLLLRSELATVAEDAGELAHLARAVVAETWPDLGPADG